MKKFTLLLCGLLMAVMVQGQTIHVPADYPTIQQAIDTANNGDTVLVSPGTYLENINFNGKNITVASLFLTTQDTSYISQTIIYGNWGGGSVVTFSNGEDSTAVLSGFKITDGMAQNGGGIYCKGSNPNLNNLTITNNLVTGIGLPHGHLPGHGGGIYFENSSSSICYVTISDNVGADWNSLDLGGGIYCAGSTLSLENVNIINNSAYAGSGIFCMGSSLRLENVNITNNEVSEYNTTDWEGCGIYCNSSSLNFENVNILGNTQYGNGYNLAGIVVHECPDVNIQSTSVANNSHMGIYCTNSNLTLNNSSITGNSGAGISFTGGSPLLTNVIIAGNTGGGLYCYTSSPALANVVISGNSAGSGIRCENDSHPYLSNVTITGNTSSQGGGIFSSNSTILFDSINRSNIYLNLAGEGNDLYSDTTFKVVVDTFTVLQPTDLFASPFSNFSFDILHGYHEQVNADLYVSPDGDNRNSGLTAGEPLKNIYTAFLFMLADSLNPHTIHLLEGTYSPSSNGEFFPIKIIDFISIEGASDSLAIFNAENSGEVILMTDNSSSVISGITITGGSGSGINCVNSNATLENLGISNNGSGVICSSSSPIMQNLVISNNNGSGISLDNSNPSLNNVFIERNNGNGIDCYNNSIPSLKNMNITGNSTGISCDNSSPELENVTISYNNGCGLYCVNNSIPVFDSIIRCNIFLNNSNSTGGRDLYSDSHIAVVVDTFSVLYPNLVYAYPFHNFSFDILHGKIAQADADLFVSPEGDNTYNGLTVDNPLRTVCHALGVILADSLHQNTIHLIDGTYSPSATGENFPLFLREYCNLAGASDSTVIIDAEGQNKVIQVEDNNFSTISDLTITGGSGNGIFCINSSPVLNNLVISGNNGNGIHCENNSGPTLDNIIIRNNNGSGIYCGNSSPTMENSIISSNSGCGVFCSSSNLSLHNVELNGNLNGGLNCNNSSPALENVTISGNSANDGGGICCLNSNVTIQNTTISENTALQLGGGIYLKDSNPLLIDIHINGGRALNGGGIYCLNSNPTLQNIIISENTASHFGGGIYSKDSNPLLTGVTISNDTALLGGGIYSLRSKPSLRDCILFGNSAKVSGGGINCTQSDLNLSNVTITHNIANKGGAIYTFYSSPIIVNSILWNDSTDEIHSGGQNVITISWSDIRGGEDGIVHYSSDTIHWLEGNNEENPLFAGGGEHPYMLTAASPCRNAGIPDTTGLSLPLFDLAGGPRIWEDRIDMGAYEWNNVGIDDSEFRIKGFRITNYPNPFTETTTFTYWLTEATQVNLKVFDNFGRLVDEPVNTYQQKGEQQILWNTGNLQGGIYYCRLTARKQVMSMKIIKMN